MISVGKHALTYGPWKMWGAVMSSTRLFRDEILELLVATFLSLVVIVLDIVDLKIRRAKGFQ